MPHCITSLVVLTALTIMPAATAHPHDDPSPTDFATQLSDSFRVAAEHIKPSVVRIGTAKVLHNSTTQPQRRGYPFVEGTGSGLIISADGHITTNYHVIEHADLIIVTLADGRQFEATTTGVDEQSDLAVIQIDAGDLTPATFAHSTGAHIGQWVLAVGCPFGLSHSYSAGIISATGRSNLGLSQFEHLVQTDAAINPGNSGGPLINLQGHVLAINTAIKTTTGTGAGVGFAIPIDMVRRVSGSLITHGTARRGFLGVSLQDRDPSVRSTLGPEASLCRIRWVNPEMPAHAAGLQAGDIIEAVNDRAIRSTADLMHAIAVLPPGEMCQITYQRDGVTKIASAQLAVRPERQRP
jgi:S1-C subfamily serine protease